MSAMRRALGDVLNILKAYQYETWLERGETLLVKLAEKLLTEESDRRFEMIRLGNLVRDTLTGFQGIAVARSEYLYGCARIAIEPMKLSKDGKPGDSQWFDEQRVVTVKERRKMVSEESSATSGGPQDDPTITHNR